MAFLVALAFWLSAFFHEAFADQQACLDSIEVLDDYVTDAEAEDLSASLLEGSSGNLDMTTPTAEGDVAASGNVGIVFLADSPDADVAGSMVFTQADADSKEIVKSVEAQPLRFVSWDPRLCRGEAAEVVNAQVVGPLVLAQKGGLQWDYGGGYYGGQYYGKGGQYYGGDGKYYGGGGKYGGGGQYYSYSYGKKKLRRPRPPQRPPQPRKRQQPPRKSTVIVAGMII
mmetsp:Transcript_22827/g.40181  ORF Transcript_22827/g.40181 Transcript_22827/m.40181 type:complete len:227 (+) Transcript_22827:71-751(+)